MGNIINVILSGGFGTRLWPMSTPQNPKQFLKIFGGKSLFQHTVERNCSLVDGNMILTNLAHYNMALAQMIEIGKKFDNKVLEPVARNTAPAITLAALSVDENDILFVTPSDHMIGDLDIYIECVNQAIDLAKKDYLVTFSIKPTFPETGYGYIEVEGNNVLSFREKPDSKTAIKFIEDGNFYWNSGMFCFKAGSFLKELKKHSPNIYESCVEAYRSGIDEDSMNKVPEESVDYAVFEKSNKIKTVPSDFLWNDMGNFDSLIEYFKNGSGNENSIVKKMDGVQIANCSAISNKRVLGIGLKDLNLIETENVILILPSGEGQNVKNIYNYFKETINN